jgi:CheY-like chemotaxis protein
MKHQTLLATSAPLPAQSALPPVVLVVENEPTIQDILDRVLRLNGFDVHAAHCASDAIGAAGTIRFDAVILDLSLAGASSGLDVLAWLRAKGHNSAIPIIVFTGQVDMPDETSAAIRRHGAHVFYKGQPFSALVDQLKRLMAQVARASAA